MVVNMQYWGVGEGGDFGFVCLSVCFGISMQVSTKPTSNSLPLSFIKSNGRGGGGWNSLCVNILSFMCPQGVKMNK